MAKVDMTKFKKDMKKVIDEFDKKETMRDVGNFAADRIVKRTRLGKGVSEKGGDSQPLKRLSDGYKKQRKKKSTELSQFTTPGKSNLTRTGQMLDSVKVTEVDQGRALVAPTGNRTDSKINKLNNLDVAGYVSKDRPFLNLSKAELLALNRYVREKIEALLKKFR